MDNLTILKIGGSVITDKNKEETARHSQMQRISKEIAKAKSQKNNLILIHGAGSFGHIQAKKFDLNNSFDPKGVLLTHNAVKDLNGIFLNFLSKEDLSVAPIHPMSCTVLKGGRITSIFTEQIKLMLKSDIIPVLHGDVVFDLDGGVRILSGDQIVTYLAEEMKAKSVGLGSNVDGIMVEDKVVEKITPQVFEDIKHHLGGSENIDVTGGMSGKVNELLKLAKSGISSCIFNASVKNEVGGFLSGMQVGTLVCGG